MIMIILGFTLGFSHPLPWILIAVLFIIPFIHNKIISNRFVRWSPSYSVGIDSIDKDHKKLLGMINQLQTAVHYTTDEAMVDVILGDLIDYTKYHFAREESLMQACNYPDFSAHKKQHDAMILKILDYIDKYKKKDGSTIDDVTQFLKSWLINHINGSDQKYSPYLRGKVN